MTESFFFGGMRMSKKDSEKLCSFFADSDSSFDSNPARPIKGPQPTEKTNNDEKDRKVEGVLLTKELGLENRKKWQIEAANRQRLKNESQQQITRAQKRIRERSRRRKLRLQNARNGSIKPQKPKKVTRNKKPVIKIKTPITKSPTIDILTRKVIQVDNRQQARPRAKLPKSKSVEKYTSIVGDYHPANYSNPIFRRGANGCPQNKSNYKRSVTRSSLKGIDRGALK